METAQRRLGKETLASTNICKEVVSASSPISQVQSLSNLGTTRGEHMIALSINYSDP